MRELQKKELNFYFLNTNKLQPGDVILERGTGIHSELIVNKTQGNFSHAMLYVGGTIIEATVQGGVYSRVPNRVYVHDSAHLSVLRLSKGLTDEEISRLCRYARNLSGSAYSIREAYIAGQNDRPEYTLTRGQFCSRLVAQAYASIGIIISDNIDFCSPADIERSNLFTKPVNMIHQGSQEEIAFVLEGGTHADHLKRAVKWVRKAKRILFKNNIRNIRCPDRDEEIKISTINDIYLAVLQNSTNKDVDESIAAAMIELGYDQGPFDDEKHNPYRYSYIEFCKIYMRMSDYEMRHNINNEFARDAGELIDRINNYVQSYNNYTGSNSLKILRVDFEINLNMIKKLKERLDILFKYSQLKGLDIPLDNERLELYAYLQKLIEMGDDLLRQSNH